MIAFLDTSVVLRVLLGQPGTIEWGTWLQAYASRLEQIEARRTLQTMLHQRSLTPASAARAFEKLAELESELLFVALDDSILVRAAEPFASPIATLDALHLATALRLRDELQGGLTFATHDRQLSLAARIMDFPCIGV